jgi:hypothetical protein
MNRKTSLATGLLVMVGCIVLLGAQKSAQKSAPRTQARTSRPTLRIGQGQTFNFGQYKAASSRLYGPNGKIAITDIREAWADVSDVVIGGTLEVTRTNPTERVNEIFVVNRLEIGPGGRILTNGNNLTVFANELVAGNNATVVAFDTNNRRAADGPNGSGQGSTGNVPGAAGGLGAPGGVGKPGESGGSISIFATSFEGPLAVDLTAQDGGNGGTGGQGGPGARGHKGEDGESGPFGCNRGGGQGGTGGSGGNGGQGGEGGHAGDGGSFGLFYVSSKTINPPQNPKVTTDAGRPGGPGKGGDGGSPGAGGEGGNGQGFCHGGPGGVPGAPGATGNPGTPGHAGVAGSISIVKLSAIANVQEAFAKATGR